MRFVDPSLIDVNRALADAAWCERFGKPLPAGQRPGRKPAEPNSEVEGGSEETPSCLVMLGGRGAELFG